MVRQGNAGEPCLDSRIRSVYVERPRKNRTVAQKVGPGKHHPQEHSIPFRAVNAQLLYQPRGHQSPKSQKRILTQAKTELKKQF